MRFIHTADWQLGKAFGRFEPEVRSALNDARFDAVDSIGRLAVQNDAGHVLVAGDVFDTEWPEDRVIVQAVSRMQRYPCRWWLLPGNHDSARAGGLWDRVRAKCGPGITLLTEARASEMEPGAWLLPAPLLYRHNLEDPTSAFDSMETPGARLRIGIAHGSINAFGAQGETPNRVPPDRAERSALDYLALGDWHGALTVGTRTWYSGTPETDRFQRDEPGSALLVDLEPGSDPRVTLLRTGRFQWLLRQWTVPDESAFGAERDRLLGEVDPAATLLQLSLAGIVSLSDRVRMLTQVESDLAHRLRYLDVRADDLVARPTEEDFLALAVEGMLGTAAARLNEMVAAGGPGAIVARRALERLFVEYQRQEAA